jgi:hypothetical protein
VKTSISGLWRKTVHVVSNLGNHEALGKLGDFTTTSRVILISLMAIGIGILSAFVALILLRLIGLFTNLLQFSVANVCMHPLTRNFVVAVSSVGASRPEPFRSYPASAAKLTPSSEPIPEAT